MKPRVLVCSLLWLALSGSGCSAYELVRYVLSPDLPAVDQESEVRSDEEGAPGELYPAGEIESDPRPRGVVLELARGEPEDEPE